MIWSAIVAIVLGVVPGSVAADADSVSGRCRDGRVWTSSPVEQDQMFALLNTTRAKVRRPALRRQPVLDRMAMAQAADMACRNYFAHRNPERQGLPDRLRRVDDGSLAAWDRLAEVIGTSATADRQVERWLGSRAHKRALLEDDHELVGVGLARIRGSRYSTYWTVEFAEAGR